MIDDLRKELARNAQGALLLHIAHVGVANALFTHLERLGTAGHQALAEAAGVDAGYVERWCDAAYAFGLLAEAPGGFELTELGAAFRPEAPGTLMPLAVGSVLSAHMAERAAGLMKSGERPGEQVLAERATILPWFGPMLETRDGPVAEREVFPRLAILAEIDRSGGTVVDLGCGNGWFLRRLAARFKGLRGIGLDGFDENIGQAERLARHAGVADRLSFRAGDIHRYTVTEPVALMVMTRALHHVWDEKERVFARFSESVAHGGAVLIWEPCWPKTRAELADPVRQRLAFQNLTEHVQGNHLLTPEAIEAEFRKVGMATQVHLLAGASEALVLGTRG